jgi:tetratricopeptide (TPR) repeat protein
MKTSTVKTLIILGASLIFAPAAFAVDTATRTSTPDLTAVRALIDAKDFKGAIEKLKPLLQSNQHADVYNLMGYSLRKSGDLKQAATFYGKALDFDPNHKGALEYQGELFLEIGRIDQARTNLAKLAKLCPSGCEEREDLEKHIGTAVLSAN